MELPDRVRGPRLDPRDYPGRSAEQYVLFQAKVVNQTVIPYVSRALDCWSFRHFTLYFSIKSTGEGTHEVCLVPQFGIVEHGGWHGYYQGLFASLCYEDTDTAAMIFEVYSGDCDGRWFRVELVPANVTSTKYFEVSSRVEFWS